MTTRANQAGRTRGLQRHMIWLVLIALLPVALMGAVILVDSVNRAQRQISERLIARAGNVAQIIDREFEIAAEILSAMLPTSELAPDGAGATFDARNRAIARALGSDLVVHDATTLATALGTGVPATLRNVLRDGRPAIGLRSEHGGALPGVPVYQPVQVGGVVVSVLELALADARLFWALNTLSRRFDFLDMLIDPLGDIAASAHAARDAASPVGPSGVIWAAGPRTMLADTGGKVVTGIWSDGTTRYCAHAALVRATGWHIASCVASESFSSNWQTPLRDGALALALSLAIGIAAAVLLSRRIARPLIALAAHAGAIAHGGAGPGEAGPGASRIPISAVTEFEALRVSVRAAEDTLRHSATAAEAAAVEARTNLRLLDSVLNAPADHIHVKDRAGRYIIMNRACRDFLDMMYGPGSFRPGLTASDILPHSQVSESLRLDQEVLASGEIRLAEVQHVIAGRIYFFAGVKTAWRDAAGEIAGVVTVARDITESRAAELRQNRLQADLLRASRLASMGAMASGLAHEINQPLAATTNYLNAALRLLPAGQPNSDAARRAVIDASEQTQRAAAIVRRLRDYLQRGATTLQDEPIAAVVSQACVLARADDFTADDATAGVALIQAIPADVGQALMDATQIIQVLLNLIRNAAEAIAARPGGATEADRITLAARREANGGVVISVSDTGPGLLPNLASRIFEPFVSTRHFGLGIGLAMCRTIVEGHGGRLTLRSGDAAAPAGAVFDIVLRASPERPASGAADVTDQADHLAMLPT